MPLSLNESQSISEISSVLYEFLPGKPHPYADKNISFEGIANEMELQKYWSGGSKLPALSLLLGRALEFNRAVFCDLILEIVWKGMIYRKNKGNPITKEEITKLNQMILGVNFKIPDLWDSKFLGGLASNAPRPQEKPVTKTVNLETLKQELFAMKSLQPQARGYAYEKFLTALFDTSNLAPKSPFRLTGEQIDGSFELETNTYLVEAKWQDKPISQDQLLIFREKVESKSAWSRGLFVSDSGFSPDGLIAFYKGRSTNIIGMTGQDIYFILEGKMTLVNAINRKARHAAEAGEFFVPVYELALK